MKKSRAIFLSVSALVLAFSLKAIAENPPVPDNPPYHVTEKKKVRVNRNAELKCGEKDCDHVIIDGTIITNGYSFRIKTKRLTFGPTGKIIAFDKPATCEGCSGRPDPLRIEVTADVLEGVPVIEGIGQDAASDGRGGRGGGPVPILLQVGRKSGDLNVSRLVSRPGRDDGYELDDDGNPLPADPDQLEKLQPKVPSNIQVDRL